MTGSEFDALAWVKRRRAAGKCVCGECQCRALMTFEARNGEKARRSNAA